VAFTHRDQARPFVQAGVLPPSLPVFEVLESSSRFTPGDGGEARRATGLAGDPCLLWVGHLDRNKDPLSVLSALEAAAPDLTDPHLWCCYGSTELLSAVCERVEASDVLRGRVHLLGRVPHGHVERLCRAADFFVGGSHREGSGYAVLEAMACGTAPLVTDIPSFRRITGEGSAGSLTPPGDWRALARALLDWCAKDRRALRRRVLDHFTTHLSFDAVARDLTAAYEGVATT
jgi:glycosyltransferase involved in cell wall biosynthesis